MTKLTLLPPAPTHRDHGRAYGGRANSRRVQRVSEKKVARFMKALWTFEREVKAIIQEQDEKPSPPDSSK